MSRYRDARMYPVAQNVEPAPVDAALEFIMDMIRWSDMQPDCPQCGMSGGAHLAICPSLSTGTTP